MACELNYEGYADADVVEDAVVAAVAAVVAAVVVYPDGSGQAMRTDAVHDAVVVVWVSL